MRCTKKILTLLICLSGGLSAVFAQTSPWWFEVKGRWDADTVPVTNSLGFQYSSCWGMAVNGHEYAIMGGLRDILVFDVTDATNPELVRRFRGSANTIREYKSYQNRLYGVAGGGTEGLMIVDFSGAPDRIERVYYSNEFFNYSHTITLDTLHGKIYLNGGDRASDGVTILDVHQNPDKPTLIGHFPLPGGYVHDAYVRDDTLYASSGFEGLIVFDMHDPAKPGQIALVSSGGYNHNSWPTLKGDFTYYTEEIPRGQRVSVVDLRRMHLGDIERTGSFLHPQIRDTASAPTPHNLYIRDNILFLSQYEDGILAYHLLNPAQPFLLAAFDTHPENARYNGYRGNWGNYPWLPSGNIITSDMQNGLFMLRLETMVATQEAEKPFGIQVTPNPVHDQLLVSLKKPVISGKWHLLNASGQVARTNSVENASHFQIDMAALAPGFYVLRVQNGQYLEQVKIFKI
jgi:choice-of-anchor B domain-containing protein